MSEGQSTHANEGENATLPVFVRLLGVPSVTLGEQVLKFRYRKAEALLYVLVVERRRMPRSRIAQLLWPGADAKSATRNLRVVLNDLRAKIGERLVAPSDSPYVSLQRVRSDLDRIESLATLPHDALTTDSLLTESATLLEGFEVEDSSEFEEWRRHADDQTQERLASERAKRVEQMLTEDASETAFALLDASVQRDPWDETLVLRLVRLALRRGDASLALRRVRSSMEAIRTELDIEPSADLTGLVRALAQKRMEPSTRLSRLVGHLKAQEDVETWVLHGSEPILGLAAAPGIGTSTFARAVLLANPLLRDAVVLHVDVHGADGETVTERARRALAGHEPTADRGIVLLDGLTDADDVRRAVHDLMTHATHVRWVYTARQPLGMAGERTLSINPLRIPSAMVLRLQRDVPSIDLFLRTVEEHAPGRTFEIAEEATLTRLLRRTGGHPLAILGLAKVAATLNDATTIDLHDVLASDLPEARALHQHMSRLLADLPDEARRTVVALALFERGATSAELSQSIAGDVETVQGALHQLQRRGWVVEDATPQRILHRVAPWAVAGLQAEAHRLQDAPAVKLRFAACIRDRVAPLAEELQGPRQREAVEEGLVMLGDVISATDLLASADPPAAFTLAAAAWPLFRRAGRAPELLARIEPLTLEHADSLEGAARADALATLANLMILVGRMPDARPLHEEALAIRDALGDRRSRAQSRLNFARVLAVLGELDASSTLLEEGAKLAQEAEESWLYAACLGNRGHVLHDLGRLEAAAAVYDEALAVLESMGDTLSIVGIRIAQLTVHVHLGQGDRVVRSIHILEPQMQHVPFGAARSLARPVRVAIDELAHVGSWHAAELLERAAYDNGFLVD